MNEPETLPLILTIIGWCITMTSIAWLADRKTKRRWPRGHEHDSFWGSARRINDE